MKKGNPQKLSHLLSGVIVILYGIGEIDQHHGSPLFFFIMGGLMLLAAARHDVVEKRMGNGESIIFFIESAVQVFICIHFFEAGKKALPFAHLFAAAILAYVGYCKLTRLKPFTQKK